MNTLKTIIGIGIVASLVSCDNKPDNKAVIKKDSTKVVAAPKPGDPMKLDSSKRYIYLTWDDSPQPPGTTASKNVFHQQGVKATFLL